MPGEHMRIAGCEGVKGLRRNGVEQRIDWIGVSRLKPRVGLKTKPCHVLGVDIVVDSSRLHLLAIIARMRNALAVRATVSIGWITACNGRIAVEGTAQNRERSPRGVPVERKELLIE